APLSPSTGRPLTATAEADEEAEPVSADATDGVPVVEPAKPVVEPAKPVVEPAKPVVEPAKPVVEPAKPVIEPDKPVIQPVKPATEPVKPDLNVTNTLSGNGNEPVAEAPRKRFSLCAWLKETFGSLFR